MCIPYQYCHDFDGVNPITRHMQHRHMQQVYPFIQMQIYFRWLYVNIDHL